MKKAKVEFYVRVPDDFEAGDCDKCPYQKREEKEVHYGVFVTRKWCALEFNDTNCPIDIDK